jgi:hypothetical protein
MIIRAQLAAVVAVAALAAAAGTAPAATQGYHKCGTVSAGGRSWVLVTTGISCATGRGILNTIVPKGSSAGFHHLSGTFAHMECNSIVSGGKHAFQCASLNGRSTLTALAH